MPKINPRQRRTIEAQKEAQSPPVEDHHDFAQLQDPW